MLQLLVLEEDAPPADAEGAGAGVGQAGPEAGVGDELNSCFSLSALLLLFCACIFSSLSHSHLQSLRLCYVLLAQTGQ